MSRLYGFLFRQTIPKSMRSCLFNGFGSIFGANLDEMEMALNDYETMNEFFIRKLKSGSRTIDKGHLVSPCDSRVMSFGYADSNILSVKGSKYSLEKLLRGQDKGGFSELKESLLSGSENELYYITLYLAPGDYHRFHSPAEFEVKHRRHIFGFLQGVFAWNLWRKSDVYATNERVVYAGNWKFGKMEFVAVAAFNVGDIKIGCDPELKTNLKEIGENQFEDKEIRAMVGKGEEFGIFNAGSTIIMVFEAPKTLKWAVNEGDRVLVGNKLIDLD